MEIRCAGKMQCIVGAAETDLWNFTESYYQIKVFKQLVYSEYATRSEEYLLAVLQRICLLFLILPVKPTTLLSVWLIHYCAVPVLCQ